MHYKGGIKAMELNKGRITSIISAIFLAGLIIVMGYILTNQDIIPTMLLNIGLPVTIIGLAAAIIIGCADYFYPTVQEVEETGARLQFTWGGILNILSGIVIVILMVITTTPTLLESILSVENYAIFTSFILPILVLILKLFIHRQPAETSTTETAA